jgi:hypothetical protein
MQLTEVVPPTEVRHAIFILDELAQMWDKERLEWGVAYDWAAKPGRRVI